MNTETISHEEEVVERLMPASGKVFDFVFGPNHRKEDESYEDYRIRLKTEHYVYGLRMKMGVNTWSADKGTFTDPGKQQRKILKKMRTSALIGTLREYKAKCGVRMTDNEVKEITSSF